MPTTATVHRQRDKTLNILLEICYDIIDAYAWLSMIYCGHPGVDGLWIDESVNDAKRTMILERAMQLKTFK